MALPVSLVCPRYPGPGGTSGRTSRRIRASAFVDEPGDAFAYGRYECDTGLAYGSVIAFGTVHIVEEPEEKTRFCVELMRKYGDSDWQRPKEFFPRLGDITVYAITIDRLTGKQPAQPEVSQRWPALDRTKSPNAILPTRVP